LAARFPGQPGVRSGRDALGDELAQVGRSKKHAIPHPNAGDFSSRDHSSDRADPSAQEAGDIGHIEEGLDAVSALSAGDFVRGCHISHSVGQWLGQKRKTARKTPSADADGIAGRLIGCV
jgi:hypothetical protein